MPRKRGHAIRGLDGYTVEFWWQARKIHRTFDEWTGRRDKATLQRLAEFTLARPHVWAKSIAAEFRSYGR